MAQGITAAVSASHIQYLPDRDLWLKRDDLYRVVSTIGAPLAYGGKARTCLRMALAAKPQGLVTACARTSPQGQIVAAVALRLEIPAHIHTTRGELGPELQAAREMGAMIIQHQAGYNSVIKARARNNTPAGWLHIPFGMECQESVDETAAQVDELPTKLGSHVSRLVMVVGSGMSLAGVLHGLRRNRWTLPVLGIVVGANPQKRLDQFAPLMWESQVRLVTAEEPYGRPGRHEFPVRLDPYYENKVVPHLRHRDLFWVVGIRSTCAPPPPGRA